MCDPLATKSEIADVLLHVKNWNFEKELYPNEVLLPLRLKMKTHFEHPKCIFRPKSLILKKIIRSTIKHKDSNEALLLKFGFTNEWRNKSNTESE